MIGNVIDRKNGLQSSSHKEILVLKGINKHFAGVQALSNMNISLEESEIHAVCGENGAGKSTLMKIITGIYKPDTGDIYLKGEKIKINNPNDSYCRGVAIIFQETSLFPDLTVLENMFMGHEIMTGGLFPILNYPKMRRKALDILDTLSEKIDLDAKINELGIAAKQIVEIAKALTFNAKILILDEPTAALTNKEVDVLFGTMKKLRKSGVSMLYISHRLDEIFRVADRVTVIRDGSYVNSAPIDEVTKEQLVSWMVGRTLHELYPKVQVPITDVVLSVHNISQRSTLRNINFTLRNGEVLGIAGLSGAGRTRLAKILCGIEPFDAGQILLNGKPVAIRNYRQALDHGIAYVSEDRQKFGLVTAMSIIENITMKKLSNITNSHGIIQRYREEKIYNHFSDKLSIKAEHGHFVVKNLSGGNQQKVAVAKALALEPQILILDEPTRGVDVGAKSEIHRLVSYLVESGKSVIMISSDIPELLGMSDRILVMKDGRVSGEIQREEMSQKKILEMAL